MRHPGWCQAEAWVTGVLTRRRLQRSRPSTGWCCRLPGGPRLTVKTRATIIHVNATL